MSFDKPIIDDNNYKLLWNDKIGNDAGIIRRYSNDNKITREIKIVKVGKKDLQFDKTYMRYIAHTYLAGKPVIVVDDKFFKLSDGIKNFMIWHEMGHIHYKHYFRFQSQDAIRFHRISNVNEGKIPSIEYEADMFAIKMTGKEAAIAALTHLLDTRPRGDPFSYNEIGRKELSLRIEWIKKIS